MASTGALLFFFSTGRRQICWLYFRHFPKITNLESKADIIQNRKFMRKQDVVGKHHVPRWWRGCWRVTRSRSQGSQRWCYYTLNMLGPRNVVTKCQHCTKSSQYIPIQSNLTDDVKFADRRTYKQTDKRTDEQT